MLKKYSIKYLEKKAANPPGSGYEYRNGGWQWSPTKQDREQLEKDVKVDQQRRQDDASRAEMQKHLLDSGRGSTTSINAGFGTMSYDVPFSQADPNMITGTETVTAQKNLIVDPDSGYTHSINAGFGTYSNEVPFSPPKPKRKRRSQADVLRSAGWTDAEIDDYFARKKQVKTYSKAIGERTRNLMERQRKVLGVDPKATTWDFHAGLDAYDLDAIELINSERKSRGLSPTPYVHYYAHNRHKEPTEGMFSPRLMPQVYGNDPVKTWNTAVNGSWTYRPMAPFDSAAAGREIMNDPSVDIENPVQFFSAMQGKKTAYDNEVAAHNAYKHVPGNLYPDHPYYNLLSELGKGNMEIIGKLYSMEPEEREAMMDYIVRYFHLNRALMEQGYNGQIIMPDQFWNQEWFKKGY